MKKYVILFCLLLLCSGCSYKYGSTTRSIRHSGFSYEKTKFTCDEIIGKDELKQNIRLYTGGYFFTQDGVGYEVSVAKQFSNDSNCRKLDFDKKIYAVFDNMVIKAEDNKYYYLSETEAYEAFEEITRDNSDFYVVNSVMSDKSVVKVQTVDASQGIYYVLKTDGNIYQYNVLLDSERHSYLDSISIAFNRDEYGVITDFLYIENNNATFFKTNNKYYRLLTTNGEECTKYADVKCEYEIQEDKGLTESYSRILGYNGNNVITTYGRVFTKK